MRPRQVIGWLLIAQGAASGPAWVLDFDPGVTIHGVVAMPDDGAVALLSVPSAAAGNYALALLRVDALGAQVWAKTYAADGIPLALAATRDGGLVAACSRGTETLLLRLGFDGNLLWARTLSLDAGSDIVETSDGSFALSGGFWPWLALVDASGDLLWARQLYTIFELDSPRIALAAGPNGDVAAAWGSNNTAYSLAYTSAGDIRWGWTAWQATGDPLRADDIHRDPAGGYFVAGWCNFDPPDTVWLAHIDDQGTLDQASQRFNLTETWSVVMALPADGNPALASGRTATFLSKPIGSDPFSERIDGIPGSTLKSTGLAAIGDGGFFLAANFTDAVGTVTGRLTRTAALGQVVPCSQASAPWNYRGGANLEFSGVSPSPLAFTSTPISLPSAAVTIASHDGCYACVGQLTAVGDLRGVRRADDAVFTWSDVGGATGYDLWYVTRSSDIDRARRGDPVALPVPGCSPPSPAPSSVCTDVGAVRRNPAIFFYQTRAVCGGGAEGP